MNKLAIVIPVFNQWAYTKRAIADLKVLPEDHLIIIVDNGSTDETKNLISSDKIQVIKNNTNLGFSKGSNRGYKLAKDLGYQNIMFLNNDIRVSSNHNDWTIPVLEAVKDGSLVGPTAGALDDNFNFICESNKLPTKGHGYISGWNITASIDTWEKLVLPGDEGPFNSRFISYFEDTDANLRAKQLGIQLKIIPVPVKHIGRVTGQKVGLKDLYIQSRKTFLEIWGRK